jgi:diguanylate cyclase (GGDEF)-like protein
MKRSRSPRELWASLLPAAGGALALVLALRVPALGRGEPMPAWLLVTLVLAGAAAACHRPAPGTPTLGLGAMILPAAFQLSGAAPAAALAAGLLLVVELSLRVVHRLAALPLQERRGFLPRSLESAGRAVFATLAAGGVWVGLAGRWSAVPVLLVAALAYLLVWIGLEAADRKLRRPEAPLKIVPMLLPFAVDAGGWIAGAGILLVGNLANSRGGAPGGDRAGWPLAAFLAACLAGLAVETTRHGMLRQKAQDRARNLERLRRASYRMTTPLEEMTATADRLHTECANVLKVFWFQFEALAPGSELKSWWWGPQSEALAEGVPEPDRYPPFLPGFHRRTQWQILERLLRARPDGTALGRIRLWCDPRLVDPREVELLDRLLPQMTAAVQRCLLDREAREDPLTGVAMRRVLEKRLNEVHSRCCESGGAMAVLLCDLDHFKRINDTFGHPVGDAALVAVSGVLKSIRRAEDLCCRYGGEEFVLLMEATTGESGLAIAERLRAAVEALELEVEGQRIPVTLSAGVASFPDLYVKTAAELILFADEALYEAKRRGRNRCLLDIGQGRYMDVEGSVLTTEDAAPAAEAPRIFA